MIKFKAFRAIDNLELSEKFAFGHENVLTSYGITKVTSSNRGWMKNPFVYVVLVTDLEGEALGGARLHVADADYPLPMEDAIGDIDSDICDLVLNYSEKKSAEICGVWNTRSLSGSGLSVLLLRACLAQSSIVVANQLNLSTLFALCAPWTVKMFANLGYEIETSVGDEGTYPYPKPDLLATVMIMRDPMHLKRAKEMERENIIGLRKKPIQVKEEVGKKDIFLINYDLVVEDMISQNKKKNEIDQ